MISVIALHVGDPNKMWFLEFLLLFFEILVINAVIMTIVIIINGIMAAYLMRDTQIQTHISLLHLDNVSPHIAWEAY